jgi:tetratricopeptide (TPR) repeat protein
MELKLKMYAKNSFPKEGVFIKSSLISFWLQEIQNMGLSLEHIKVFPVPGKTANELYGCIVFLNSDVKYVKDIGKNNFCQLVENKLFIPENTIVFPELTAQEWNVLFSEKYHFMHPEIGFVELEDELIWSNFITKPNLIDVEVLEPRKSVAIPKLISSLRIEVDQEELLKQIENPLSEEEITEKLPFNMKKLLSGNNKEMDKFLAYLEKNPEMAMKMAIPIDTIGTGRGANTGSFSFNTGIRSRLNFSWIRRFFDNLSSGESSSTGFFRYGFVLLFVVLFRSCKGAELKANLTPILVFVGIVLLVVFLVTLLSKSGGSPSGAGGGSFLIDSNRFNTLQSRYEKLAQDYIARKEYEKAAHIYLKLLKNNHKAAKVLEDGKLYREAAVIYLKYLQDKKKAAECYEKGHAYNEAIALYKEMNEHEKVGDLYLILKNKKEADKYFTIVIDNYVKNFQYVKASLIYKNKIGDVTEAQELLLDGWKTNKDAGKCLNNYFANIDSNEELSLAIADVYKNDVISENKIVFLHLLKTEFKKSRELEEITRNIAYEIASEKIEENPNVASELIHFNKSNKSMIKDVLKFKLKTKNKL